MPNQCCRCVSLHFDTSHPVSVFVNAAIRGHMCLVRRNLDSYTQYQTNNLASRQRDADRGSRTDEVGLIIRCSTC
jgi:hypothetical protein